MAFSSTEKPTWEGCCPTIYGKNPSDPYNFCMGASPTSNDELRPSVWSQNYSSPGIWLLKITCSQDDPLELGSGIDSCINAKYAKIQCSHELTIEFLKNSSSSILINHNSQTILVQHLHMSATASIVIWAMEGARFPTTATKCVYVDNTHTYIYMYVLLLNSL